jgi:hypothetical protein
MPAGNSRHPSGIFSARALKRYIILRRPNGTARDAEHAIAVTSTLCVGVALLSHTVMDRIFLKIKIPIVL